MESRSTAVPNSFTNPAMLSSLTTEQRNPTSTYLDLLSTEDMLKIINLEDAKVAPAVALVIHNIALAVDAIADRMLDKKSRLMYIGAGTSGRLGVVDASECPPTFNTEQVQGFIAGGDGAIRKAVEGVEDSAEKGRNDIISRGITSADSLIGIAASGRTPYVIGALDHAREIGAFTVGLACNEGCPMEQHVDLMITPVCGPEVVTGSTRMKAGTATKLVLNMLSTGVMIRIGKTYGNLMVDMQPSNYKLELRAVRIVMQALDGRRIDAKGTGFDLDNEQAEKLLNFCGKDVKLAILVGKTGMSPHNARKVLKNNNGILAKAIQAILKPAILDITCENEELYLAIDGGGTKTLAVIVNKQGHEIGCGRADGSNISTTTLSTTIHSIFTAAQRALEGHNPHPSNPTITDHTTQPPKPTSLLHFPRFRAIWIGLAGADRQTEHAVLMPKLTRLFSLTNPTSIKLSNDIDLLSCPLTSVNRAGVTLIAGTGSIAISYDNEGKRLRRVGGWGYVLGDEGSGYAIGLAASKAVVRILDGRDKYEEQKKENHDSLLAQVMKYWGCDSTEQYIALVYGRDMTDADRRNKFAGLASTVFKAYAASDGIAVRIVEDAAEKIAELVFTCLRDFIGGPEKQKVTIVVGGSVVVNSKVYRELVLENVRKEVGKNVVGDIIIADCPARMAAEALARKS